MASATPKDLRPLSRFITDTNNGGKAVFSNTVSEDAPVTRAPEFPVEFSLMYTLSNLPARTAEQVDITDYGDYMKKAPSLTIPGGVVGRIVDYPPGFESPMHRTRSVDLGIVIDGEIELLLDSGETRLLKPGDVAVQRATMHAWKNVTPAEKLADGSTKERWARMFYVLIDAETQASDKHGNELREDLGDIPRF